MYHPIILSEIANLHRREIEKEMLSWQLANQAKPQKNAKPRPRKRFGRFNFFSDHSGITAQAREAFSR